FGASHPEAATAAPPFPLAGPAAGRAWALVGNQCSLPQRPRHRLGFFLHNLKQDAGAALGLAAALLPVAHSRECKAVGLRECFLRQTEPLPNLPDIDLVGHMHTI